MVSSNLLKGFGTAALAANVSSNLETFHFSSNKKSNVLCAPHLNTAASSSFASSCISSPPSCPSNTPFPFSSCTSSSASSTSAFSSFSSASSFASTASSTASSFSSFPFFDQLTIPPLESNAASNCCFSSSSSSPQSQSAGSGALPQQHSDTPLHTEISASKERTDTTSCLTSHSAFSHYDKALAASDSALLSSNASSLLFSCSSCKLLQEKIHKFQSLTRVLKEQINEKDNQIETFYNNSAKQYYESEQDVFFKEKEKCFNVEISKDNSEMNFLCEQLKKLSEENFLQKIEILKKNELIKNFTQEKNSSKQDLSSAREYFNDEIPKDEIQNKNFKQIIMMKDLEIENLKVDLASCKNELYVLQESLKEKEVKEVLEDDFKDKLSKQGVSLLSLANRHIEGREKEIKFFSFEIQKKDKIIQSLHEQIYKKDIEIYTLQNKLDDIYKWKENICEGKLAFFNQREKDTHAKMALSSAEIILHRNEKSMLLDNLNKLEDVLRQKDAEIKHCLVSVFDHQKNTEKVKSVLKSKEFELQLKNLQLVENTQAALNRESELLGELEKQKTSYEELLEIECKKREEYIKEKTDEIAQLKDILNEFHEENKQINIKLEKEKENNSEKEKLISLLQNDLAENEAKLHANDKTAEVEILRIAEKKHKNELAELTHRLEMLQEDSIILDRTRIENVELKREIFYLRETIKKLEMTSFGEAKNLSSVCLPDGSRRKISMILKDESNAARASSSKKEDSSFYPYPSSLDSSYLSVFQEFANPNKADYLISKEDSFGTSINEKITKENHKPLSNIAPNYENAFIHSMQIVDTASSGTVTPHKNLHRPSFSIYNYKDTTNAFDKFSKNNEKPQIETNHFYLDTEPSSSSSSLPKLNSQKLSSIDIFNSDNYHYIPTSGDSVDLCLSKFLHSQDFSLFLSSLSLPTSSSRKDCNLSYNITRLDEGIYAFKDKKVFLQFINGIIVVRTQDKNTMNIKDFISSEIFDLKCKMLLDKTTNPQSNDKIISTVSCSSTKHKRVESNRINPFATAAANPVYPQGRNLPFTINQF